MLGLFSNEISLTEQQKSSAFTYLMDIITERIYTLSLEQFARFMLYFECLLESLSLQDTQRVLAEVFKLQKLNNQQDQKYYRLLFIKSLALMKFNLGNKDLIEDTITMLKSVNPLSIQQLPVFSIIHIAVWSYYQSILDVNLCRDIGLIKDIDSALADQTKIKKIDEFNAILVNEGFKDIYNFIAEKLNADDLETKKKYYRLTRYFASIFKEDLPFKTQIYQQMKGLYPNLIQFKVIT